MTRYLIGLFILFSSPVLSQDTLLRAIDTPLHVLPEVYIDSTFRITNLNPYITLHADSSLNYDLHINRPPENYFWYLRNSPVGMRIDRNSGILYFKADKSYFKSGKLKYDQEYKVLLGVQNINNPLERVDTSIVIVFYNTEILPSRLRPAVSGNLYIEEGDSVRFKVQCEQGSFPIEQINMSSNLPISNYTSVHACDESFQWMVPFDFIRDDDTTKQRQLVLQFVGADKFFNKDTATVRIFVRPGINYPLRNLDHKRVSDEMRKYILELKLSFYFISKSVKSNKRTRTSFDISGSTTALAGTALATAGSNQSTQNVGKILPSVGLTLVPVKEAVAPNKIQEQNTATQVRSVAKRLEYLLSENSLLGERDFDVLQKTKKLQDEMRQARNQLLELPVVEFDGSFTAEDAEKYFNDPKVNKRYKLKVR